MSKKIKTDAKRETVVKITLTDNGNVIGTFADGTPAQILCNVKDLAEDIRAQALFHGLKQKLVDSAALSRDPKTGKSATPAEKRDAVMQTAENLRSGVWNTRGTGDGGSTDGLLVTALCEMQPKKDVTKIREWVGGLDKSQQSAMRANPKVAAIIARIQTERAAAKGIDTDAMLNGMEKL